MSKEQKTVKTVQTHPILRHLLNGHTLQTTENKKDLGVIVDNKLKFHTHTAAAIDSLPQLLSSDGLYIQ